MITGSCPRPLSLHFHQVPIDDSHGFVSPCLCNQGPQMGRGKSPKASLWTPFFSLWTCLLLPHPERGWNRVRVRLLSLAWNTAPGSEPGEPPREASSRGRLMSAGIQHAALAWHKVLGILGREVKWDVIVEAGVSDGPRYRQMLISLYAEMDPFKNGPDCLHSNR